MTITDESFRTKIASSCFGDFSSVQRELQADYLGYIVIRPIPSVPIGRTVLVPMSNSEDRNFDCLVTYKVHLCGIELMVEGLAFQQQDRAVGACATTAIWSALQRLCKHEGRRAPTPSAITESAVKYFIPNGRPYPSAGLRVEQICDALRAWDYPPILLNVGKEHKHFKYMLNTYIRSGIPVILAIVSQGRGHAVTVVGYRGDKGFNCSIEVEGTKLLSSNLSYEEIYIHDDRLGPYARAYLRSKVTRFKRTPSKMFIDIDTPSGQKDTWEVFLAIVPVYNKIRTSAYELFDTTTQLAPIMDNMLHNSGTNQYADIQFMRCGEYLESLYARGLDPNRITNLVTKGAFSRYVGVLRWSLDGLELIDFVWDTTDILRKETRFKQGLSAIVSLDSSVSHLVDALANYYKTLPG